MKKKTNTEKEGPTKILDKKSDSQTNNLIVKIRDLHKIYKVGEISIEACKGLDLNVKKGTFQIILGPSGTGKTTLLNCIGGLDHPDSGDIWVNYGNNLMNISKMNTTELVEYRRHKVGIIFQFYNLVPILTALENVQIAAYFSNITNPVESSISMLKKVGLKEVHFKKYPNQLSGGEQQRVAIARALIKDPILVLADEPTGNLDSKSSIEIYSLMKKLCKEIGLTFIIVTHNQELANEFGDSVLYLRDGRINLN